jgi:hypothetical protein
MTHPRTIAGQRQEAINREADRLSELGDGSYAAGIEKVRRVSSGFSSAQDAYVF